MDQRKIDHLDYNLVHHAIIKLQGPAGESKSIFIALIVKATFFIEVSWECDIINFSARDDVSKI